MIPVNQLLQEEVRFNFIKWILENQEVEFKNLYSKILKISETNARHHMNKLIASGILIKVKKKGKKAIFLRINPNFLSKLRNYFKINLNNTYLSSLGTLNYNDTILHLRSINSRYHNNYQLIEGINFFVTKWKEKSNNWDSSIIESSKEWKELKKKVINIEVFVVDMHDFNKTKKIIQEILLEKIISFTPIVDITGGPKIPSLALFMIALEYGLEAFYYPKDIDTREIKLI